MWCKNPPGINLTTGIPPLITNKVNYDSTSLQPFLPHKFQGYSITAEPRELWEHGLCRMKFWLSPVCGSHSLGMFCLCSNLPEVLIWHLEQQHHPCFKQKDGRSKLTDLETFKQKWILICSSKPELLHTRHGWYVLGDFSAAQSSYLKK